MPDASNAALRSLTQGSSSDLTHRKPRSTTPVAAGETAATPTPDEAHADTCSSTAVAQHLVALAAELRSNVVPEVIVQRRALHVPGRPQLPPPMRRSVTAATGPLSKVTAVSSAGSVAQSRMHFGVLWAAALLELPTICCCATAVCSDWLPIRAFATVVAPGDKRIYFSIRLRVCNALCLASAQLVGCSESVACLSSMEAEEGGEAEGCQGLSFGGLGAWLPGPQ
jgi:hypothetical protein